MKDLQDDEEDNVNAVFSYLYDKGVCLKTEYEKDASNCKRVNVNHSDHS